MGSVKRFWAALMLVLPQAYAESLPAAVVQRPYSHQLTASSGFRCAGYQLVFEVAAGSLPEGLRLFTDGRIAGEASRVETGAVAVRVTTPCSAETQTWNWTVRGAPMLFVEPAEVTLESEEPHATALVCSSWHGLPYSVTTASGAPVPAWLRIRPRRGRTPAEGSAFTGDQLILTADPALAPPNAEVELLIHTWQGSDPAPLKVRFGP